MKGKGLFEMGNPRYPAHWWMKFPRVGVPPWEILPSEAREGELIISKRNELGCLSNFAYTPFDFRGKNYKSIEGWWQMMFYPEDSQDFRLSNPNVKWNHSREEVSQMYGFEAWFAGVTGFNNLRALGINWVTFEGKKLPYWIPEKGEHYCLVVDAMRAKLAQNPEIQNILLGTVGLRLRADHYEPADAPPSWEYYRIWMELRDELVKGKNGFDSMQVH